MVVEHYLHAVLVRKVKKPLHIGEKFGIYIVTPAVFAGAPVGVNYHYVQRHVMLFVIQNEPFRLLFGVGVVFAVPPAKRGKTNELGLAREFNVQFS